jgi:hypothetical protein
VDFSAIFKHRARGQGAKTERGSRGSTAEHTPPVTPDSASPPPRPTIPYVKQPVFMDYGLRVKIAPTTFINRNCKQTFIFFYFLFLFFFFYLFYVTILMPPLPLSPP